MDQKTSTPILLMTFNRPKTTKIQLDRFSKLSSRNVYIAVDGPRGDFDLEKCKQVQQIVENWAEFSHHRVSIVIQNKNLGLHNHFLLSLEKFFSDYTFGIVLEDDIEFRESFIHLMDSSNYNRIYKDFWSIQGYNPLKSAISDFNSRQDISLVKTNFHSVWGWGASSISVESMLKYVDDAKQKKYIERSVAQGSRLFTSDPFLRNAIANVWLQKLQRARSLTSGGWDNWWVAAAWFHQSQSLMPTVSISRESLNQAEGQSHVHAQFGDNWGHGSLENVIIPDEVPHSSKADEISLLNTWGIGRKYSWLYSPRVIFQLSASKKNLEVG